MINDNDKQIEYFQPHCRFFKSKTALFTLLLIEHIAVVLILWAVTGVAMIFGKIPKKYSKTLEDKLFYCDICYKTIMNIEEDLLTKSPEDTPLNIGGRIDSNGKRIRRSNNFVYSEDQVTDTMDKCCDDQLKYQSTNEIKTCKDFIHELEDQLIESITQNEEKEMRRFCKKYVSKKHCKSIIFPQYHEQIDQTKN